MKEKGREGRKLRERERESKERRKEARSIHINTLFFFLKHTKQQSIPR